MFSHKKTDIHVCGFSLKLSSVIRKIICSCLAGKTSQTIEGRRNVHVVACVYCNPHSVISSVTMVHAVLLVLISLSIALGPAVSFYGASMTFMPGIRYPDGTVEVCAG